MRPLKNNRFCTNSASGSNYNPRNIQYIPAVIIFDFLDLAQNRLFFKGLIMPSPVACRGLTLENCCYAP
ncbi:MAG: hypothetical protein DRH37_05765 [Deltaproteobacteria bacterium]|nr:MAG: hypothetical protein DRH37_05765 [Deltaproteobacteria bacterium]